VDADEIEIGRVCSLCGDQISLVVETPGVTSTTSSLRRLLDLGADERAVIIARCGCDRPRSVAVRGGLIREGD
jgi:hypothetical protein